MTLIAGIDFEGPIEDAVSDIATFIPKLVVFLLVLLIGMFIAKWIRRAVVSLLRTVKFDEYIDKAGIGAPLERAGFADSGRFVAQILYYLIALLVLKLALSSFGDNNPISEALDGMIEFIPKLVIAIAIIIITGLVANAVGNMVRPALADVTYGGTIATIATTAIWIIGGFAALDQIEIASDIVNTLFTTIVGSLGAIMIIKFGVGGIWAARDHFWPAVYNKLGATNETPPTYPSDEA